MGFVYDHPLCLPYSGFSVTIDWMNDVKLIWSIFEHPMLFLSFKPNSSSVHQVISNMTVFYLNFRGVGYLFKTLLINFRFLVIHQTAWIRIILLLIDVILWLMGENIGVIEDFSPVYYVSIYYEHFIAKADTKGYSACSWCWPQTTATSYEPLS